MEGEGRQDWSWGRIRGMASSALSRVAEFLQIILHTYVGVWPSPKITPAENALNFVNSAKGFLGTAKHFYVPEMYVFQHHFLVKTFYYEDEQAYTVEMIHFTRNPQSNMVIGEPFKISSAASYGGNMSVQLHSFSFSVDNSGTEAVFTSGNEAYFRLLNDGSWFMVEDSEYPNTRKECDDVWRKAKCKSTLDKKYSLKQNNCEHFVTEMLTGTPVSRQLDKAYFCYVVFQYIVGASIFLHFALIIVLIYALSSDIAGLALFLTLFNFLLLLYILPYAALAVLIITVLGYIPQ